MATLSENLKLEARRSIASSIENSTGIFGQTIRDKRIREEKQRNIQSQVQRIQQTTGKLKSVNAAFSCIEASFIQMSANFRLIAKAMDAQVTLQEETDKLQQEESKLRKQTFDISKEKTPTQQAQTKRVEKTIQNEQKKDESLFSKLSDLIDGFEKRTRTGRGGRIGRGGRFAKFGKFAGRVAGKVLGPLALAEGIYESKKFLDETKYGERMAQGEGKIAQKAFRERNADLSAQPLTQQQAQDILDSNSRRDIEAFGGRERLEKIAGISKPVVAPPVQVTLPPTGAGGGRGMVNPALVTPAAEPAAAPNVVMSQHGVVTSGSGAAVTFGAAAAPSPSLPAIKPPPPAAEVKPPANATPKAEEPKVQSNGKFSSPNDFVNALFPYAQKVSQMIGGHVPPIAILGQWAGESGAGSSMPADFNYAGIKAGSQFAKGDFVLTEERYTDAQLEKAKASGEQLAAVLGPDDKIKKKGRDVTIDEWYGKGAWQAAKNEGKNWVQVKSYFAKFKNFDDFASSFARFISAPRYAKAREQTTPAGFGLEIAKAGYATASAEKYSAKIANFAANQGNDIGNMSTAVAAARKDTQPSGGTTIVAVNNTQVIKKPPQAVAMRESSTLVAS